MEFDCDSETDRIHIFILTTLGLGLGVGTGIVFFHHSVLIYLEVPGKLKLYQQMLKWFNKEKSEEKK